MCDKHLFIESPDEAKVSRPVLKTSGAGDSLTEFNLLLHLAQNEWERSEPYLMQAWKEFQINCERVAAWESRLSHSSSPAVLHESRNG
jgi:hypothetical protein